MIVSKKEVEQLSSDVRKIIDGQARDLRDNREGKLSILKNEIHILAGRLNEQADILRQEKEAMSRTLADISHQLKTPLTSAMMMAELLTDAPPEKQAELATGIKTALARTEWMVSALLKMAKLEAGTIEFSRESITVANLINMAMEPLQILLEVKNQRVVVSGDANLQCDKRWTAEALSNIIKNASEHSPDGGEVTIEVAENPIAVCISVRDSGDGLTRAGIASMFQRFQGSHTQQGYGIGLPLALAIMRKQNGDIDVDGGGKGRGATFTLKLYARD